MRADRQSESDSRTRTQLGDSVCTRASRVVPIESLPGFDTPLEIDGPIPAFRITGDRRDIRRPWITLNSRTSAGMRVASDAPASRERSGNLTWGGGGRLLLLGRWIAARTPADAEVQRAGCAATPDMFVNLVAFASAGEQKSNEGRAVQRFFVQHKHLDWNDLVASADIDHIHNR